MLAPIRRTAVSVLVTSAFLVGSPSPEAEWTPHGPYGGVFDAVALDPQDESVVYVASASAGVFRTTDGGTTWTALESSPSAPFDDVIDLQIGPDGTLWENFFNDRLYRGTDEGVEWSQLAASAIQLEQVEAVALVHETPGLVFLGGFYGLSRSDDAGETWQRVESFPGDPEQQNQWVHQLVVDGQSTLWAAVRGTESEIYRSEDLGASWQPASTGLGNALGSLRALAAAPGSPGTLVAATAGAIFTTTDGGESWSRAGDGPQSFIRRLVIDPANRNRLWAITFGMPFVSTDFGATWSFAPGFTGTVSSIAAPPSGSGRLYAASDAGVYRSDDDGASWQLADATLLGRSIVDLATVPNAAGGLILAAEESGLWRSTGDGLSWSRTLNGPYYDVETTLADPNVVYALGASGLLRSDDGGLGWQATVRPDDRTPSGLWVSPADPDLLFTTTTQFLPFGPDPSNLQRSRDGGQTWDAVLFTSDRAVSDVAFGAGETPVFVAILRTSLSPATTLRSTDGGDTWEPATDGLTIEDPLIAVAGDPATPGRFLGSLAGGGLVESADGALSWHPFGSGLPTGRRHRLLFDSAAPATVFAASEPGFYRSTDGGATWSRLDPQTPPDRLRGTLASGLIGQPRRLFTATIRSVWSHLAAGSTAPCEAGANSLCLHDGRFEVTVGWQDFQGGSGAGNAVPITADSGAFWFFREDNLELVVKALDGRPVNGRWWIFYGSLSNVAFTLTVRDTGTGERRLYENPPHTFASRGDTAAFPLSVAPAPAPLIAAPPPSALAEIATEAEAAAVVAEEPLCLNGGRFCVRVTWEDFQGAGGAGHPIPLTDDTGALWFFDDDNLELAVKVLDGRPVNGHWWVFYGSLTNVAFTLTVTDTETERTQTYENPSRHFASRGDTTAFE